MNDKKICSRCLLTEETPGIHFDERGVCNYCIDYIPMKTEGEENLMRLLDQFRDPSIKYECMICVSGGRDSTYVLWKMVHDYKMRALAVTYQSPFLSKQAQSNVESAVKRLKVDHLYWEYPKNAHFNTTKKHLKIWGKKPSSIMIPFVCAHCKSWNFQFYKIAREHKIPLIIFGSNPLETASFKKAGFGGARTYGRISNIPNILSKSFKELYSNPSYLTANWGIILKMYLGAGHSTPFMRYRNKDIMVIRLFDYLKWDEKVVESTIAENIGWKKSSEVESSWRFDCRLDYIRRLMYHSVIGVTELRDLFSKMIREGILTREEAIQRLKKEESIPKSVIDNVLNSFGLTLSDLNINVRKELISD
jgi:hypothetical protein